MVDSEVRRKRREKFVTQAQEAIMELEKEAMLGNMDSMASLHSIKCYLHNSIAVIKRRFLKNISSECRNKNYPSRSSDFGGFFVYSSGSTTTVVHLSKYFAAASFIISSFS